jgi:hypothetical protein
MLVMDKESLLAFTRKFNTVSMMKKRCFKESTDRTPKSGVI